MSKFVAVVYVEDSQRPQGDLACFVGDDKDVVVQQALVARDTWTVHASINGPRATSARPYRILVGELTESAERPIDYRALPEAE